MMLANTNNQKGDKAMASMKFGIFKILGLMGLLAEELGAAASDGKISLREAVNIVIKICEALGIKFDDEGIDLTKLVEK